MVKFIEGGVCAPKGFRAAGINCGIKKGKTKEDLALIFSQNPYTTATAAFTQNRAAAAPIEISRKHLQYGRARAIIANSGNANACVEDGYTNAERMAELAAKELNLETDEVLVASTGVIGESLNIEAIEKGMPKLVESLSVDGSLAANRAIMTTDLVEKSAAVEIKFGKKKVRIGGIAKGSGMINPNLATMLVFITTDVKINSKLLQTMLLDIVSKTFNRVSVDGDTSTNDTIFILANGESGFEICENIDDALVFSSGLWDVCGRLARGIAKDGEGATKLIECQVFGASSTIEANAIADSVINSPLVKTAMFACDPNWGRILSAVGNAKNTEVDISKVSIRLISDAGSVKVCKNGKGQKFDEEKARKILAEKEIVIEINSNRLGHSSFAWGCDLSYDYVKINAEYRT